jgi:hypothetical protein
MNSKKEQMMKLHIWTQDQENYGAHDWDGKGQCPEYWKFKGGHDYSYALQGTSINPDVLARLVHHLRPQIETDNEGFREYIIGWEVVADDFLSEYEQSQMKWEGRIQYPTRQLALPEDYSPYRTINS